MLFHTILQLQGFPIEKAHRLISKWNALSPKQLCLQQESQKWDIFQHHRKTTMWYQKMVGNIPHKWEDIPILQKRDYQAPFAELLSTSVNPNRVYVGSTSGSSGHPFYYAKDKWCHALTWANIMHQYKQHHISIADKQARFYGIPKDNIAYWKEKIKDYISNRERFPVFDLSDGILEKWLSRFRKRPFVYTYGYTSAMTFFARFCISKQVVLKEICPTLRTCIVTSETCTPEDREILQAGFGVPVINEYGASETDVMAFEQPNGVWRVCLTNIILETVDQQGNPVPDGEEGKILVTALHNRAMPIIRYDIGDVGILAKDTDSLPVLAKLSGRINDMVVLPSGRRAAGLTFYYISRSLLESGGFLREFIIRQTALDTFVFEIVSDRELRIEEIAAIQEKMNLYLEPGLKLVVNRVPQIERKGSGKIKHFYSELN